MFKKSELLKKYGLWLKTGLIALFIVCLGGMNCITFVRENANVPNYQTRNHGLNDWDRPQSYVGEDFEDWKKRRDVVAGELKIIFDRAEAKGTNYTLVDYFQDIDQLIALEDKYNFYLTSPNMLEHLVRRRDALSSWKRYEPNSQELKYIAGIQKKWQQRDGLYEEMSDFNAKQVSFACLYWLVEKYLILMLFWGLIYIIGFEEHEKAYRKFQQWHHENHFYFEAQEPFSGQLSFYDEMLIAPWRFALRVILWPKYFWNYPRYESPAQMLRFNRIKAEFLRYKPLGYQLTAREETILLAQARKPVKDIERAIASLFQFPALVRRSVYLGYLSLVLGFLFQPAITLAASYSKKVDAHFYGQNQTVLVEQQYDTSHQIRDGTEFPRQHHDQTANDCLAEDFQPLLYVSDNLMIRLADLILLKPKEIFFELDHIPLSGLCLRRVV
ncbi:MAG: hypothetical protein NTX82_03075 [Candidatus Parcubacteria bacterium]|nr:hypothetical protein [Candidatus Parcubacteria bacterium]